MQLDPGNVSHCLMRSPYRYKLDHRLRITSLPSLVKGSGKQSSFSSQLGVRPSYRGKEWSVSNENFEFKIRKNPCVNCTERSGIVRMCLLRDSSQAQGWKVKLDNLPPCESSFRLFFFTAFFCGGLYVYGRPFVSKLWHDIRAVISHVCLQSFLLHDIRAFFCHVYLRSFLLCGVFIPKYMTIFLQTRIYMRTKKPIYMRYKQACGIWGHRKSSYKRHRIIPSAKNPFMYDGAEK